MVDLPIPDEQVVTAQTPQNRVSGMQYARSGNYLADGLQKLADGLNDVAVPLADQAAANDLANTKVTLDANGTPIVGKPAGLPILGPAGQAYDHAVAAGALAAGNNDIAQHLNDLRVQFDGDPQGFRTAATAFAQNLQVKNGGQLGQSMFQQAAAMGTQYADGMVNEKAKVDIANSKLSIDKSMQMNVDTMAALAAQGDTTSPTYLKNQADYAASSAALVANPAFGISKDVQAQADQSTAAYLQGMAVTNKVDADMKGPGGITAALKNLHDGINDPSLPLSEKQRAALQAQGEARVQYNVGQNAVAIAANNANFAALKDMVGNPATASKVSEQLWQAAISQSLAVGDTNTTKEIAAMHQVYEFNQATKGLAPNQSLNSQGLGPTSTVVPPTGAPAGGGNVAEFQQYNQHLNNGDVQSALRLSEGLRTNAYWDVNHWRTGYGSDTVTRADGTVEPVTATTTITPADAERDLQRRTGLAAQSAQSSVGAAWSTMTPGAQAALTSVVYNYGHVPSDIAAAASGGNAAALSAAISSHANDNGGVNFQRRQAEAGAVMGQFGPSGPQGAPPGRPAAANGVPFTQEQLNANPFLLSAYVKSIVQDPQNRIAYGQKLGTSIQEGLKNGFVPEPANLANYAQIASNEPQLAEQATHIKASIDGLAAGNYAINLPPGQAQPYIDHVTQLAQGASFYQQEVAAQAKYFYDKGVEGLKKDPAGTAVAKGWIARQPDPLNFDDPLALGVGMHQRSAVIDAIATRTGDQSQSPVLPGDLEQFKSVLANGTDVQKMNMAGAISSLPEARRNAAMASIGSSGKEGQVFAVAGSVNQTDPDAARSIMAGQTLLKQDPRLAPKADDFQQNGALSLPPNDFTAGVRGALLNGAEAYYAKLSADAGDTTQNFNQSRWDTAVNKVSGGIVDYRGSKIIVPSPGMPESDFKGVMSNLTDADLAGSRTAAGTPLPASKLQPSMFGGSGGFRLQSFADGRYLVFAGTNDARSYLRTDVQDARDRGGPFILDLRGKQPTAGGATASTPAAPQPPADASSPSAVFGGQ